jgi:putative transposase
MLVNEATRAGARVAEACKLLKIGKRTLQRWKSAKTPVEDQRPLAQKTSSSKKLTEKEKTEILEVVNNEKYCSLPPSQIVPALADEGRYIASESSFYRHLREKKMQNHRGKAKAPVSKPLSTHMATAPNQVWTWDISYLNGPIKGMYYYLYMIIDIFSRNIVGWEIWLEESTEKASELIEKAYLAHRISTLQKPLILHSDNGSPMKGATMLETLYKLGIVPSRSRPRVSNDNPYSESLFRTFKYRPEYPSKGFLSLEDARAWAGSFVTWYNTSHRHSGIQFVTPREVHTNQAQQVLNKRREVYAQAKARNPARWSGHCRKWELPERVWLNPEKMDKQSKDCREKSIEEMSTSRRTCEACG